MNAKNLHKHSLPVLGLLAVAFVLSISVADRVATASDRTFLAKVLVTRIVRVEPTANGLAHIQINHQLASVSAPVVVDAEATSELQSVGDSSGKLVRLSFVVEALNPIKYTARN